MTKSGSTIKEEISKIPTIKLQLIDGSTYAMEGKVDAITGVIDQSTGSVSIRAIFPNKEHVLRSGGTANVLIPYNMENVISIPQSATVEIQDKKFVYKVVCGKAGNIGAVTVEKALFKPVRAAPRVTGNCSLLVKRRLCHAARNR